MSRRPLVSGRGLKLLVHITDNIEIRSPARERAWIETVRFCCFRGGCPVARS